MRVDVFGQPCQGREAWVKAAKHYWSSSMERNFWLGMIVSFDSQPDREIIG